MATSARPDDDRCTGRDESSSGGRLKASDVDAALDGYRSRLSLDGIDLLHPTSTGRYNRALFEWGAEEGPESAVASLSPLPSFGRKEEVSTYDADSGGADDGSCLALILGSTGALWRPFLRWLDADRPSRLEDSPDPLDSYVSRAVERALRPTFDRLRVRHEIFWAWEVEPDRVVAMARAAELSGMAHLDGTSHLSVHPTYGAWFSLRAVVVLDLPPLQQDTGLPPDVRLRGILSDEERRLASEAFDRALAASSADLGELWGREGSGEGNTCAGDAPRHEVWRQWVVLRDVVRRGREEHRFEEDQIEYHYTKKKAVLRRALSLLV